MAHSSTDNFAPKQKSRQPRGFYVLRGAIFVLGFFVSLLIGGFFFFVASIPNDRVEPMAEADAIVVLTGGAARIQDALSLLQDKHAKRLLITGVHPNTSKRILAGNMPQFEALFDCCVDIDHRAMNTVGNAIETGHWAVAQDIRSLIVVTSSYHMPRSLVELSRIIPDVALTSYPVVPENVRVDAWWAHPGTLQLLSAEYLKYLTSLARKVIAG